ncbi:DUF4168 domain-containing protein [Nitrincola schmidtii]|uniref:DUF4168 domain-containing protein n=1 Tax=Nitrincola schmidtii TaxID=1730894 RepID=UPI00124CC403|nr:DUF4168 domain-containing protein [Nitrincola schmidtii]
MKKTLLAAAITGLLTLGATSHVMAYEAQSPMPAQQTQVEFTETDLQTFAAVQGDLDTVRAEYSARLEAASDQEQAAQLQQEASIMMIQAVEAAGMEVETYNEIALALQSDPALRDRVAEMLN